jgi:rod shape-determining protein MreC
MMSKSGNPAAERIRSDITDIVTPVLTVANSPLDTIHDAATWFKEMSRLREENSTLQYQNRQLLQWQAAAKELDADNHSLRNLLNVIPSKNSSYITARIVSDVSGPYLHAALIDGGNDTGVKKDEAVTNENGLIGRVISTGANSSRVLLLSDINSHVPVVSEHTQEKSILTGNNTDLPTLSYLRPTNSIAVGERIVTSGDGGIFPPGIPVGVVTSVEGGVVKVDLFADVAKAKYVNVVDYAF